MPLRKPIEIGQRFGRLTYLAEAPSDGRRRAYVRCDCGKQYNIRVQNLYQGKSLSCGCFRGIRNHETRRTHGFSGSSVTLRRSEYRIWSGMIQRCTNPNYPPYARYGALGVGVCERWRKFEHFYEDMGARPPGRCLQLISRTGHYEPGNCRWVTRSDIYLNAQAQKRARSPGKVSKASVVDRRKKPKQKDDADHHVHHGLDHRRDSRDRRDAPQDETYDAQNDKQHQ